MSVSKLTQADLVVLSLLLEQPMHGYDLVQQYERQEIRDWASVSKAQVYYALKKLEESGLIVADAAVDNVDGRGKTIYTVTSEGKAALESELGENYWLEQRRPQPFTTWVGLSIHSPEVMRRRMMNQRRAFLESELQRERKSYDLVAQMTSDRSKAGLKIIDLTIALIETEIRWIDSIIQEIGSHSLVSRSLD